MRRAFILVSIEACTDRIRVGIPSHHAFRLMLTDPRMRTKKRSPSKQTSRKAAPKKRVRVHGKTAQAARWSQRVTRTSDAMDLKVGIFTQRSAAAIARSLKQSVQTSKRRKSPPFRSAMSMLNFEINRAGKGLPEARRRRLNAAKIELRRLFHRDDAVDTPRKATRKTPASRKAR